MCILPYTSKISRKMFEMKNQSTKPTFETFPLSFCHQFLAFVALYHFANPNTRRTWRKFLFPSMIPTKHT